MTDETAAGLIDPTHTRAFAVAITMVKLFLQNGELMVERRQCIDVFYGADDAKQGDSAAAHYLRFLLAHMPGYMLEGAPVWVMVPTALEAAQQAREAAAKAAGASAAPTGDVVPFKPRLVANDQEFHKCIHGISVFVACEACHQPMIFEDIQ